MPVFNHLGVSVCYSLDFDNIVMMKILHQAYVVNDCMKVYLQKFDTKYSDLYAFPYENLKLTDENMQDLFSSSKSVDFKNKLIEYNLNDFTEINFMVPVLMMQGRNLQTRTSCRNNIFSEISMDIYDLNQAFKNAKTFLVKLGVESDHIKIGHNIGIVDCCIPETDE
jgi:hypothetical protein